jgi:DNA segregation ATPase FtsK/SpoIIIE, S-DNA-T family
MTQAAVLHSPNDLRFCLLTESSRKVAWEWARWLPHCRPDAGTTPASRPGRTGRFAGQAPE